MNKPKTYIKPSLWLQRERMFDRHPSGHWFGNSSFNDSDFEELDQEFIHKSVLEDYKRETAIKVKRLFYEFRTENIIDDDDLEPVNYTEAMILKLLEE